MTDSLLFPYIQLSKCTDMSSWCALFHPHHSLTFYSGEIVQKETINLPLQVHLHRHLHCQRHHP